MDCWMILGIGPTEDEGEIKHAWEKYVLLRLCRKKREGAD